jgi:hypothetical protein
MADILSTNTHYTPDLMQNTGQPDLLGDSLSNMDSWGMSQDKQLLFEQWLQQILKQAEGWTLPDDRKALRISSLIEGWKKSNGLADSGTGLPAAGTGSGAGVTGTLPGTGIGAPLPGSNTGPAASGGAVNTSHSISSSIGSSDVQQMSIPPVDDNITAVAAQDLTTSRLGTGASEGKDFLASIAGGDIDTTQLERRIRTAQAGGGLLYGGAAAKQEANIVSSYVAGERLAASKQLSDLTVEEATLDTRIMQLFGETETNAVIAASSQLTPLSALSSLYAGSQSALDSIFGLGGLL